MVEKITVVILAAGKSSRFWPFSSNVQKSMIPLLGKPILEYTLSNLKKAGLARIILVVSKNRRELIKKYFKDGRKLGISIDYAVQKEPLGQANAILAAKDKIISKNFFVLNDYQLNASGFLKDLLVFKKQTKADVVLLGKTTDQPSNYGILDLSGKQVKGIVEKPKQGREPSNIKIVGIYLLNKDFLKFMDHQPVEKYQLEAALNKFCQNKKVFAFITKKQTLTLKYPWHLLSVKDYLLGIGNGRISNKAYISKTAVIQNPEKVVIEDGAIVGEFALIEGPAYIGPKAILGTHSILRKGSLLEEKAQAQRYCDVSNSIFFRNAHIHSSFVGDSVIGENCRIGADFVTANKRMDRAEIKTLVNEQIINTKLISFGTIIGPNTRMGIRVSTMPGKMIGKNCFVGPSQIIAKNLPDNSKVL